MQSSPVRAPFYIKLALTLFNLIALVYIAFVGRQVLMPILFAFLFAILLLPLTQLFEYRMRMSRGLACLTAVVVFVVSLAFIGNLLGLQIASLAGDWPQLKTQLLGLQQTVQQWLQTKLHIDAKKQAAFINDASKSFMAGSSGVLKSTLFSVSALAILLTLTFIYTFFFLYLRKLLVRFLVAAFTDKHAGLISEIAMQVQYVIKRYIVGLVMEMLVVSCIAIIVFLTLGVKYFFLLGLLVGILNILPYVGIFTALAVAACVTFATAGGNSALLVAVSVICIHLVDSNFLMPRIVGSHVKLNAFFVIIGVVLGEMIWGIPGMFLSVPYLAIAKVVFDRIEGLQPWGVLIGEEEHTPKKVKPLQQWMKRKPAKKP